MKQREHLPYRVISISPRKGPSEPESYQCLLLERNRQVPNMLGCLYGAHLHSTTVKANTAKKAMNGVAFLMSWSSENDANIHLQLAQGKPLTLTQCRAFTAWLKVRADIGRSPSSPEAARTFNATVGSARRFIEWTVIEGNADNLLAMKAALEAHARVWGQLKPFTASNPQSIEDLEDDEIREIETFLRYAAERNQPDNRVAARDYVTWRLAIEYGLRIGEILALRLNDLPSRTRDYLTIVRTDQRDDLVDPRGAYAPKVKTLGRDLGYFFRNTRFPELFSTYQASHRWVWARRKSGASYQRTRFAHPY